MAEKKGGEGRWLVRSLCFGLVALVCFGVFVLGSRPPWVFAVFDEETERRFLEYLGIAMGGVLLALGAVFADRRAKAMAEAAQAQAEANRNAEKGQLQERLKNAIDHLGHGSPTVRAGGALELERLARDAPELREIAHEILYAHERRDAGGAEDGDDDN